VIGSTLQRILDEKGFNVNELSKRSGVSAQTLYSIIKRDNMKVDIDVLIKICRVLNVSIDVFYRDYIDDADFQRSLNKDEMLHVEKYRTLDEYGKKAVDVILDVEHTRAQEQVRPAAKMVRYEIADELSGELSDVAAAPVKTRSLALYDLPASAGTGVYLHSDYSEYVDVPLTSTSRRANFLVRVSGDSMEPAYADEDILLIQATDSLEPGEIGLFVMDDEGYVKKLGHGCLVSLNPAYSDIAITDTDSFRVRGRVLGKLEE
jgi:transcriptional regulator with XRE-family HTH domain